jgi:hypothetical protein
VQGVEVVSDDALAVQVEVEEAAVVDDVVVALVQDQDLEMSKIS